MSCSTQLAATPCRAAPTRSRNSVALSRSWIIAQPQNLIEAWGKNASIHFVFTRQNRGKLDELSTLVDRGQLRPHVGAVYALADLSLAHARLETPNNGVRGKIVIAVEPSADMCSGANFGDDDVIARLRSSNDAQ